MIDARKFVEDVIVSHCELFVENLLEIYRSLVLESIEAVTRRIKEKKAYKRIKKLATSNIEQYSSIPTKVTDAFGSSDSSLETIKIIWDKLLKNAKNALRESIRIINEDKNIIPVLRKERRQNVAIFSELKKIKNKNVFDFSRSEEK